MKQLIMESWDINLKGRTARANATRAFCEYMDQQIQPNIDDRKLCTTLPHSPAAKKRAREIFAQVGHFYREENHDAPQDFKPIPEATEFRIYEADKRDDLVTIVLPPQDELPPISLFVARDYYRCTYWPYVD